MAVREQLFQKCHRKFESSLGYWNMIKYWTIAIFQHGAYLIPHEFQLGGHMHGCYCKSNRGVRHKFVHWSKSEILIWSDLDIFFVKSNKLHLVKQNLTIWKDCLDLGDCIWSSLFYLNWKNEKFTLIWKIILHFYNSLMKTLISQIFFVEK